MSKTIIMGAGPAGLAAGYQLEKNGADVTLLEMDGQVGGISKTIDYKGYHFDLGGHRFFTKFDVVENMWREVLGESFVKTPRLSRIYYRNRFFNYPLTAMNALFGVGIAGSVKIVLSYIKSRIFPYKKEDTFEEWVSNRFGKVLYSIFFKTYTEKVWGIPCSNIQAEWAAQRIKGLSLVTAIVNAVFKPRNTKIKTLIDEFDYPVLGPGMMYDAMSRRISEMGGEVRLESRVSSVNHENFIIKSVDYIDESGNNHNISGENFISSIPVTELVKAMNPKPGKEVLEAAEKLSYRSIVTVDIVIKQKNLFPDNWIYIHSPEVKLGRIQNFKNWSSKMVPDENKTSLGLEYFCNEGDEFWDMPDQEIFNLAASEVEKIKICNASDIIDYTVIRVPKAYPVYSLGYREYIGVLEEYFRKFSNLQLIGRYGLFKYNNMDHSILTGIYAASNIIEGKMQYDTWNVNVDQEYQEEKT